MVIKAGKFTPEVLLGAPRRSQGIPNVSGDFVLFTVSTYSFSKHTKTEEFKLLERSSGTTHTVATDKGISDFVWLDEQRFIYLQPREDGNTDLHVATISAVDNIKTQLAATLSATASSLKVAQLAESEWAIVFAAEQSPDGSAYNEKNAKPLHSTGKLYNSTYVRHWDRYETKERNALWYSKLIQTGSDYRVLGLTNALKNTPLECPIRPFGGTDHFDLSHDRIIFVSRDPESKPALTTKNNVYLLTIESWQEPPTSLEKIAIGGGAKTCPVFSPDGSRAAFLAMYTNGYESDQNRIYIISDVQVASNDRQVQEFTKSDQAFWTLSPGSISWAVGGRSILAIAEDRGRSKLFYLPIEPSGEVQPRALTQVDSISAAEQLASGYIFTSGSSFIDNSIFQLVHYQTGQVTWSDSSSGEGSRFGLHRSQVKSIWTLASNPEVNKQVHSWLLRPSNFEEGKKYPVAYLIHGGPQSAWNESWSTRWNPAVFAEQGYIVVCPNPTGSTGYGQKFTDAINNDWGGDPYQDIVNVFEWVGKNIDGADNDRAVALGGSYGGYMVNWIQGHDLGRKFKALVNHDGIFSTVGLLATDELYFPFADLGSTPFYDPKDDLKRNTYSSWKRWDPTEYLDKWETPELVIHSARDFRLAISEGLATYNVLQARSVPSQFLTFPDENHWVLKPENSLVWHKTVFNWINKYVGLPPYADEDDIAFFGGIKDNDSKPVNMPTQGNPAI